MLDGYRCLAGTRYPPATSLEVVAALVVQRDIQTLGFLPDGEHSEAIAVSADGAVVAGTANNGQGQQEAFRWTEAGGMQRLGLLPGGA